MLEHEADATVLDRDAGGVLGPRIRTRPESGCSRPAITRSSVDLPLPLGPSRAVSEPSGTSIETSSRATKSPNCFRVLLNDDAHQDASFRLNEFIASSVADRDQRQHQRGGVGPSRLNCPNSRHTQSGAVSVSSLIRPETIATAPNSPSARAVASTTP